MIVEERLTFAASSEMSSSSSSSSFTSSTLSSLSSSSSPFSFSLPHCFLCGSCWSECKKAIPETSAGGSVAQAAIKRAHHSPATFTGIESSQDCHSTRRSLPPSYRVTLPALPERNDNTKREKLDREDVFSLSPFLPLTPLPLSPSLQSVLPVNESVPDL